eukprot:g5661.t1
MAKDKLRVKKMLFFYLPHSTKSDNSTKQIIEKTLKRNPFNYEVVTSLAAIEEAVAVHAIETNVLIWSSTFMSSKFFSSIKYKILLNHFPRSIEVGHKVHLYRNLRNISADFFPISFSSLTDWRDYIFLEEKFKTENQSPPKYWITKPSRGGGGRRIKVWSTASLIQSNIDKKVVVQAYISNPLLIEGTRRKFDIRAYVLVLKNHEVYFYDEGLLRLASKPFSMHSEQLGDPYVHVTNNSVNKRNSIKHGAIENLLWSEWNSKNGKEVWKSTIMPQLKHIAKVTFGQCLLKNADVIREIQRYKDIADSFELFGMDCIVDENFKVWLLEVNHMPEIETSDAARADKKMNDQLMIDMFTLVLGVSSTKDYRKSTASKTNMFCKLE